VLAALTSVGLVTTPTAGAFAHTGPGAPDLVGTAATVQDCLSTGQVWLLVVTERGRRLRSECVGSPATGMAALTAADVRTSTASGGHLCTLAGHPEACPRTFDGQYWQYWHADGLAAPWRYSDKGAESYSVPPGSVEGWCRNRSGEERCRLPALDPDERPMAAVDLHHDQPAASWAAASWAAASGVVVLLGAAGVLWLRRRDGPGGEPRP